MITVTQDAGMRCKLLKTSPLDYLPSSRELSLLPQRREHPVGCPPCQLLNMDLLFTRELFEMPSAYAMAGTHQTLIPSNCVCGKSFTVVHALSCPRGGYPSIRHNELRDITAQMLTTTCHGVGTEPSLQPLTGELMSSKGARLEDGARLDIVADNFWGGNRQRAFFDVWVFNPFAPSHRHTSLPQCYRKNELEKKRVYEERVREVEHGSFSPLVFSTSGGMGLIANTVYRRIAATTAEKHKKNYSKTLFWLRCKLSFSLLRSAIMCLRGAQSSMGKPSGPQDMVKVDNIDLACSEGRIPSAHDLAC